MPVLSRNGSAGVTVRRTCRPVVVLAVSAMRIANLPKLLPREKR
jgi:hypothetical protein